MRTLILALSAASITAAAPAQDEPPRLFTPSGPWAMEYADDSCRLIRNFNLGAKQITLALERHQPGTGIDIGLAGNGIQVWSKAEAAEYAFLPGGKPTARTAYSSKLTDGRTYYLLTGASLEVEQAKISSPGVSEPARTPRETDPELAAAASIDTLVLSKGFKDPPRLALGSMVAPMAAMHTCIEDLLTHWGVDAKAHRSLSRQAGPIDLKQLSSAITYPMNAELDHRDGFVRFRLMLDREGKPTNCVVTSPRGAKEFESVTCRSLERAQFLPALDASRTAIASYYIGLVRFNVSKTNVPSTTDRIIAAAASASPGQTEGEKGYALYEQGRYAEAEPLFRKALDIRRRALGEGHADIAANYGNLASSISGQGRWAEAEPLFRKALDIFRTSLGEKHPETAIGYNNLGYNLRQEGRDADAEPFLRKALEIRRAILGERHLDTAESYGSLAASLVGQGRAAEAELLFRKELDIRRAELGEDHLKTADGYSNLAISVSAQGRFDDVEPLYRKTLDIRRATFGDNRTPTAESYINLGSLLNAQGRYAEAEPLLRKALEIFRAARGENDYATASGYHSLANNLGDQGRHADAEPLFRKALDIDRGARGENHPITAGEYDSLASNLGAQGRYAAAEPLFRKALDIYRATIGENHPNTAAVYDHLAFDLDALGKYTEAESLSLRAIAINLLLSLPRIDLDENSHAEPFTPNEKTYLLIASHLRKTAPASSSSITGRAVLAAEAFLQSASSRASILAAARTALGTGTLAQTLRQQQDLAARSSILDREILKALGSAKTTDADRLSAERDAAMTTLATLNAQIDRQFPTYRAIISPQPVPLEQIQSALPNGAGLLLLIAVDKDLYSFGISRTKVEWVRVEGGAPGALAQITHLRCQVDVDACSAQPGADEAPAPGKAHSDHFDMAAAYALYSTLVAPVEQAFSGAKRLYVTTSGALGDLPLGALATMPPATGGRDDTPAALARAPWLADRYAITYLPAVSGLLVRTTRPINSEAPRLTAYGDPDLHGNGQPGCTRSVRAFSGASRAGLPEANVNLIRALCPLPESAAELRRLAKTLGAPQTALHLRDQATESRLHDDPSLGQARVIAFATHGALAGEGIKFGFEEPGLILTPPITPQVLGNGMIDDGVLTASEVSQLSLSADWVILSACNTASAQGSHGNDGLSALSRSFLYAGARALLASHWRVADDSASILTVETMRLRQANPGLTRAQALQEAMHAIRTGVRTDGSALPGWFDSFSHPADWAPFTLIANSDE